MWSAVSKFFAIHTRTAAGTLCRAILSFDSILMDLRCPSDKIGISMGGAILPILSFFYQFWNETWSKDHESVIKILVVWLHNQSQFWLGLDIQNDPNWVNKRNSDIESESEGVVEREVHQPIQP